MTPALFRAKVGPVSFRPMPKRKAQVPATVHLRVPVSDDERDEIAKRAGEVGIAAYIRKLLGLAPRRPGRPTQRQPRPGKAS